MSICFHSLKLCSNKPFFILVSLLLVETVLWNKPFSKMAAENSDKLKLAKIKNVYQH